MKTTLNNTVELHQLASETLFDIQMQVAIIDSSEKIINELNRQGLAMSNIQSNIDNANDEIKKLKSHYELQLTNLINRIKTL